MILKFTISFIESFFNFCPIFSRIRSKITIVALMEYPTKVNIHAINVFPTEIFVTAYTMSKNYVNQKIGAIPEIVKVQDENSYIIKTRVLTLNEAFLLLQ